MKEARGLFESQLRQQASILNVNADIQSIENTNYYFPNNAFQIFNQSKVMVLRSLNTPEIPIADFSPGFSTTNFSGYRWRVYVMYNITQSNWIMVAEREDIRHQLADAIIMESIFPIVISIPIMAILIWLIVSFGLKPIHELAAQLRSKQASDLSPIVIDAVPEELMTLAASANDLLMRMDRSFLREKRFNADVAHELRTPIAALNIHLQNLLNDLEKPPETAIKMEQGLQRINHLIEQIILLNRMTPDHYRAQFSNIELIEVTRNVIGELLDEINMKKQTFEFDGENCLIYGDVFAIETLIKNIVHNAIKYTPDNGKIVIRIKESEDKYLFQVMDNGPGIPDDEYDHVFGRFYRLGGDRHSSATLGCGLGLSIVAYIAELHDAQLHLGPSEFASGLLFTVSFPAKKHPADITT